MSQATEILLSFEPSLNKNQIQIMLKKLLKESDVAEDEFKGIISESALTEFILNHKMKGYGKEFFTEYLSKRINKVKEMQTTRS